MVQYRKHNQPGSKRAQTIQHQKIDENLQVEVKEAASNEDVASSYQPVIVGRKCGGERLRLGETPVTR
jgi:hypothetical protein